MREVVQLKCPTCGKVIPPDNIHGTIVYCTSCKSYSVLKDNRTVIKNVFYKIHKSKTTQNELKKRIVDELFYKGEEKFFDLVKPTGELTRYYLPVREIKYNGNKLFIPLNEQFKFLDTSFISQLETQEWISSNLEESGFTDLKTTDYKPLYIQRKEDKIEFLPIDVSMERIDALYRRNKNDMLIIKYIPLTVLPTTAGNILTIGSDEIKIINDYEIDEVFEKLKLEKEEKGFGFRAVIGSILGLVIMGGICAGIYKFLTMGITADGAFNFIFNGIGYFLLGIWAAIWLGLYFIGAVLIFAPPLIFLWKMIKWKKNNLKDELRERDKGYKNFAVV